MLTGDRARPRWLRPSRMAMALAAAACLYAGCRRIAYELDPFSRRAFDRRVWMAGCGDNPDCARGPMARQAADLVAIGMPRAEVRRRLGEPDDTAPAGDLSPEPQPRPAGYELYCLGNWSGFRIDTDYLYVAYDAGGRAAGTWVVQH